MANMIIDVQIVKLLVEAIDKMKIIESQPEDVREKWAKFIGEIQVSAQEELAKYSTEQALLNTGTVQQTSQQSFI